MRSYFFFSKLSFALFACLTCLSLLAAPGDEFLEDDFFGAALDADAGSAAVEIPRELIEEDRRAREMLDQHLLGPGRLGPSACCVCSVSTKALVQFTRGSYLCRRDFNKWFRSECRTLKEEGFNTHFSFSNDGELGRKLHIKKDHRPSQHDTFNDDYWRTFLDEDSRRTLEKVEAPVSTGTLASFCTNTLYWLTQSFQSLKTWSNCCCCCSICPQRAERYAEKLGILGKLFGNPYFERCPHCQARVHRLRGCPKMRCERCERFFVARQQVECPLCVATVGCSNGLCGPSIDASKACCTETYCDSATCWAVFPCEDVRCKAQCFPCCSSGGQTVGP